MINNLGFLLLPCKIFLKDFSKLNIQTFNIIQLVMAN